MGRPRRTDKHLPAGLYVKHGRTTDTYFTIIAKKYVGLGGERKAAEAKLRTLFEQDTNDDTIAALAEKFIAHLEGLSKSGAREALAARTIDDYAKALRDRIVPVFGHMKPMLFQGMHAAQYLARPENAGRKVRANREIAALGSMFSYGMSIGVVASNPCHGVRRNKEFARERRVSIAELNHFIEVADKMGAGNFMVALIGATVGITGRRRAEILGLKRSDLGEEGMIAKEVKVKAGERQRVFEVQWSPVLREIVTKASERKLRDNMESFYVFPTRSGTPYTDDGFVTMWKRTMKAFINAGGEHFTAHDLRALYVTEKLERGENPNTHKNTATMERVYNRAKKVKVTPLA